MTSLELDHALVEHLKPTCVRIVTPTKLGSGFLATSSRLITCWHVVDDVEPGDIITCTFRREVIEERKAKVLVYDTSADLAVLQLDAPLSGATPLALSAGASSPTWTSFVYPAFMKPAGKVIRGHVVDWKADAPTQEDVLDLFSEYFDPDTALGGMSGAPVVTADRRVVGVLFCVLGDDGARKVPHLHCCYAIPVRRFPRVIQEAVGLHGPDEPTPLLASRATLDARAAAQLERYTHIVRAKTPGEVIRALGTPTEAPELLALVACERLLAQGDAHGAYEILNDIPFSPRQIELLGLTLSLLGKHEEARNVLRNAANSSEAGSVTGGVLKRLWLATKDDRWRDAAYDAYSAALDGNTHHYPAINLASLALARGALQEAKQFADEAVARVESKTSTDPWAYATLAEAALIRGNLEEAATSYRRAAERLSGRREIAAMRRQARRNLVALGRDGHALDHALDVGAVATLLDLGPEPFDSQLERRIADVIVRLNIRTGCVAPRGNAERAFARAFRARGHDLFLVAADESALRGLDAAMLGHARIVRPARVESTARVESASEADARGAIDLVVQMAEILDEQPVLLISGSGEIAPTLSERIARVERV